MKNTLLAAMAALVLLLGSIGPAGAITDGEYDGYGHPFVGVMVAFVDGEPAWRCSGTLVSSKIFVTAGHCTYGAESVQVWFAPDIEDDREGYEYPYKGDTKGTAYTHPSYDPNAFYLYDLGVVVLNKPIKRDVYGELPYYENQLDDYGKGTDMRAVGYGLQASFPTDAAWKDQAYLYRMVSYPRIIQINSGIAGTESLLLSNNANTGGTCFGDSGGPNFIGGTNIIGGVTSFGMNGTCAGTGGVYRIDRPDDFYWLWSFLE